MAQCSLEPQQTQLRNPVNIFLVHKYLDILSFLKLTASLPPEIRCLGDDPASFLWHLGVFSGVNSLLVLGF